MPQSKLEKIESIFKIIAVLIGGAWTIYIFRYQNIILPSREPIAMTIKVNSQKVGQINDLTYFKLFVTFKNESKISEKVSAAYINSAGEKIYTSNNEKDYGDYAPGIKDNNPESDDFSNYKFSKKGTNRFFQFSKLLSDNFVLAPDEEQSTNTLIAFPTNKFDLIHTEIVLIQSKKDAPLIVKWEKDSLQKVTAYLTRITSGGASKIDYSDTTEEVLTFIKRNGIFTSTYHHDYLANLVTEK